MPFRFAVSAQLASLAASALLVATACVPARTDVPPSLSPIAAAPAAPEEAAIKLDLPADSSVFLPVYLADRQGDSGRSIFEEEGLSVEIASFSGSGAQAQALAGDSIDISVAALNNLTSMIAADQPVKGFYGGASLANFAFYSQPDIKSWEQLKGKTMAISSPGGLTDVLARYALRKHGLEPEKDVNLVVAGAGAANLAALQAGRVDAVVLTAPFTWQAEDAGFTTLGTQTSEVASEWPRSIYYSKDAFIQQNPNTLRAFLRAHVRAIRLAKANPDLAIQTLQDKLKLDRDLAKKSYDELVSGLNERGAMPSQAMPVFWQISVATGDVTEPWAEERYLDRRFIDTFEQWAPPAAR